MSLSLNIPTAPHFVKDGVIVTVTTTTTGVAAHYIVLEVWTQESNEWVSLKHPVIDSQAIFNIADIINNGNKEEFSFENKLTNYPQYISWKVKASEIYDNSSELIGTITSNEYHAYKGSGIGFSSSNFMSKLRNSIIHIDDVILLYANVSGSVELTITYKDSDGDILNTESVNTSIDKTAQILIQNLENATRLIELQITSPAISLNKVIADFPIIDKKTILYRNSFGVYDLIYLYAHAEIEHGFNFETFNSLNGSIKYNSSYIEKTKKANYPLGIVFTDESSASEMLKELFLSEETYELNILPSEETYELNFSQIFPAVFITEPIVILNGSRIVKNTLDQTYFLEVEYEKKEKNA